MAFLSCLSDSKYPQVSRNLHRTLADLNSAIVWMVSSRVIISNSSSLFTNTLVTVRTLRLQLVSLLLLCSIIFLVP